MAICEFITDVGAGSYEVYIFDSAAYTSTEPLGGINSLMIKPHEANTTEITPNTDGSLGATRSVKRTPAHSIEMSLAYGQTAHQAFLAISEEHYGGSQECFTVVVSRLTDGKEWRSTGVSLVDDAVSGIVSFTSEDSVDDLDVNLFVSALEVSD